jgi:hypothetical protein
MESGNFLIVTGKIHYLQLRSFTYISINNDCLQMTDKLFLWAGLRRFRPFQCERQLHTKSIGVFTYLGLRMIAHQAVADREGMRKRMRF